MEGPAQQTKHVQVSDSLERLRNAVQNLRGFVSELTGESDAREAGPPEKRSPSFASTWTGLATELSDLRAIVEQEIDRLRKLLL